MGQWTQYSHWARGQPLGGGAPIHWISQILHLATKQDQVWRTAEISEKTVEITLTFGHDGIWDWRTIKLCLNKELHILIQWQFNDTESDKITSKYILIKVYYK